MADFDKLTDELAGKAALGTGMRVAKRALQDALLSDEERAARAAEEEKAKSGRRTKLAVYAVIGLLLVVGLIGLAVAYWYWFLLAGLAALGVLYGRHRWRKRREARSEVDAPSEVEAIADAPVERTAPRREIARPQPVSSRSEEAEPPAPIKLTAEEAEAEAEALNAELAAMKARLRK